MIRFRLKSADGTVLAEQTVDEFPLTLGRSPTNGLACAEAGVSSTHAEIDWDGHHLHLRDRQSRNGTFVEGNPVKEMVLNLPCTFRLGKSVTVEAEVVPVETHELPAVFRVATPKAAIPAPEPERAAPVVEEVLGEERYWLRLQNLPPRVAAIFALAITSMLFFVELAVFRQGFVSAMMAAMVSLAGSFIVSAALAAVLALPGLITQGKFQYKPLFLQLTACLLVSSVEIALRPAILVPHADLFVRLLCVPLILFVAFSAPYVFLFTTFPSKHARRLFHASLALSVLLGGWEMAQLFRLSRPAMVKSAFLGTFPATRGLAGTSAPVSAITDELRALKSR